MAFRFSLRSMAISLSKWYLGGEGDVGGGVGREAGREEGREEGREVGGWRGEGGGVEEKGGRIGGKWGR